MGGNGAFSISEAEAAALIEAHDGDVALLFLYLRHGGKADSEDAARALCRTRAQIEAAQEKLQRMGLLSPAAAPAAAPVPAAAPTAARTPAPVQYPLPADELPEYTAHDIAVLSRDDATFASLVAEAQRVLGRVLSSSDLKKLFGIYDYLALPPAVILLLLNYCVNSSAIGNPPTMRYIEKEAYTWANREILTLEQAEEYIASSKRRKERIYQLAQTFGITGRALSPTENKYLTAWLDMGFEDELILMAYDRTVTSTGNLKWSYMNGILKSWHDKGLLTPEDVREKDTRRGRRPKAPDGPRDYGKLLADLDKI